MSLGTYTFLPDGHVASPVGFLAGATACGLKESGGLDMTVIYSHYDCKTTAVFTQNQVVAAPVIVDRETLAAHDQQIRAVVANAGNANACTGAAGLAHAQTMQQLTAAAVNCEPHQVLVLSTGIIGVPLPMSKIEAGIHTAAAGLTADNGRLAAEAIMTTDSHPKQVAVTLELANGTVTLAGMAKGAGMIHPNMATMLAVLTTDAVVSTKLLPHLLKTAVDKSFNCISIDGDTSPNDTVLLLANGASGVTITDAESMPLFREALTDVCTRLAKMIVQDGEGTKKVVEIQVSGAETEADAHAVAATIATSPLVKTALAGSDPNWGRILAAAGRAGVAFDQNQVQLWIGVEHATELRLLKAGTPTEYDEADAAAIFAQPAFIIQLDLGMGSASETMWTTDLTCDYVRINADYRT